MHESILEQTNPILSAEVRRLHRVLLHGLVTTGIVSPPDTLAVAAGIEPAVLPARLSELVAADYAAFDTAGRLTCLYPFSVSPTPHVVRIDGQRRHAMCAVDALGIPAMLDREVPIEAECGACGTSVRLVVRPGEVVAADPISTVVVARRDEREPAATACCPFTVFACTAAHGQALVAATTGTHLLSLAEALVQGEAIFGDQRRADALPARRRRWPAPGSATTGHEEGPGA